MSRYCDYDADEQFPNEAALWWANAERALKGKRGRKVLVELREALLNLPEKRLIARAMCTVEPASRGSELDYPDLQQLVEEQGEGVCAVGAYLWWRKVKSGVDPVRAFRQLPTLDDMDEPDPLGVTADLARQEAGLTYSLAWQLAFRNDEDYKALSPEQRYEAFLRWIDKQLQDELATTPTTTGG